MIGPCYVYSEPSWEPEPRTIKPSQATSQIRLFRKSVESVLSELKRSYQQTLEQYGPELAEILELQTALLEDKIFLAEVEDLIKQKNFDAAYATFVIFRRKKELFLQMGSM